MGGELPPADATAPAAEAPVDTYSYRSKVLKAQKLYANEILAWYS
jgi:hypothetical protein